MNDQATLLKWAQQLNASKQACVRLLDAVSQQGLALPAIHEAGLLQPLCAALRSKDARAQQRAVAVLLEASRCGPGGEQTLAAAPGCCQALLDLVAAGMPVASSVFEGAGAAQQRAPPQTPTHSQQQPLQTTTSGQQGSDAGSGVAQAGGSGAGAGDPSVGGGNGGYGTSASGRSVGGPGATSGNGQSATASPEPPRHSWEEPAGAACAACSLLWRLSAEGESRELLLSNTSALVQELLPVLVGLLARAGPDLRVALSAGFAAAASAATAAGTPPNGVGGCGGGGASGGGGGTGGAWSPAPGKSTSAFPSAAVSTTSSPEASPRDPAIVATVFAAAAAAGIALPTGPQPVSRGPTPHTDTPPPPPPPPRPPPPPQLPPYLHMQAVMQAGSVQHQRGTAGGVGAASGVGPWHLAPVSPPSARASGPTADAEAVAATLAHVAGLLRVLACNPAVAAALAAQEGAALRRLLRAMVQAAFRGAAAAAAAAGASPDAAAAAGPAPLDPVAALTAAAFALHTLRLAASAGPAAAEALVAADGGALACVRTLTYYLIQRSMEQTMPLDEQVLMLQAVAAGTLARLAEHPAARSVAAVAEALAPPLEVLSALALLLLLPVAVSPVDAVTGHDGRCFVASLLAAIAQYGPYNHEVITQVIVSTRGALGTIIALLPNPSAASASVAATGSVEPTSVSRGGGGGLLATGPAGTPLSPLQMGMGMPLAVESPSAGGGGGGGSTRASGTGGFSSDPFDDATAAGVDAALVLCGVAAHSRDVARVLAGKTTLVPTLLAVLRERRGGEQWPPGWHPAQAAQAGLRVRVLRLLATLTTQLGEPSVRGDLVADSGLVPGLLACLGPTQPPAVVAAGLEWLSLLLQHPAFLQDRMQESAFQPKDLMLNPPGPTVNEILSRLLELLQLLPAPSPSRGASQLAMAASTPLTARQTTSLASGSPSGGGLNSSLRTGSTSLNNSLRGGGTPGSGAGAAAGGGGAGGGTAAGAAGAAGNPSLNTSLRGGGTAGGGTAGMRGGGGGGGLPPSAFQSAVAAAAVGPPVDLALGNPAVAAAAAVALHRLAASGASLRTALCGVPGLIAAVLRQVHGLLDQLAMEG
ncbi:hypothetical protein GPECTOR_1g906 [Gonium pectorale]|uniref:Uncharacterized protein n=1 Tax=Gonium pectorale TaxID=33097 RepID=A0A150H4M6_GONPE|nr:hypothetical protein GPECTOR_1g906 [Gonium pectorale]|eukprot:KXZ57003.1 hypothetical protein GPECTOR_1g906 [Gonium pectorale]